MQMLLELCFHNYAAADNQEEEENIYLAQTGYSTDKSQYKAFQEPAGLPEENPEVYHDGHPNTYNFFFFFMKNIHADGNYNYEILLKAK